MDNLLYLLYKNTILNCIIVVLIFITSNNFSAYGADDVTVLSNDPNGSDTTTNPAIITTAGESLTITPTGSIVTDVMTEYGVHFRNAGGTVINQGTIDTVNGETNIFFENTTGSTVNQDVTINNSGDLISLNDGNNILVSRYQNLTVTNTGTMSSNINSISVFGTNDINIRNFDTGVISAAQFGIFAAGDDAIIMNDGLIESTFVSLGSPFDAVVVTGDRAYVENNGTIIQGGADAGVEIAGNDAIVINNGDITGHVEGISVTGDNAQVANNAGASVTVTNRDGIFVSGDDASITNAGDVFAINRGINFSGSGDIVNEVGGTISVAGAAGFLGHGIYAAPGSGALNIRNDGAINTADNFGNGIFVEDPAAQPSILNTGSIQVTGNGVGVLVNDGANIGARVENRGGTIFADDETQTAIFFDGEGDDTLLLGPNSLIQGRIYMGSGLGTSGNDTVRLDLTGDSRIWVITLENFSESSGDTVNIVGASGYVEEGGDSLGSGVTIYAGGVAAQGAASAVIGDVNGAVGRVITDRIDAAWALNKTLLDDESPNENTISAYARIDGGRSASLSGTTWQGWGSAFGGMRQRAATADVAETVHGWGGVIVGADSIVSDQALLGFFGGYAYSSVHLSGSGESFDSDMIFGGAYGRLTSVSNVFADFGLTFGYGTGELMAGGSDGSAGGVFNNLAPGGVGTPIATAAVLSGSVEGAGAYVMPMARIGAMMDASDNVTLIPSATVAFANQWRDEESPGASIDDRLVSVLIGRMQMGMQTNHKLENGHTWITNVQAGLEIRQDLSDDVVMSFGGSGGSSTDVSADDPELGGFIGANLMWVVSEKVAFNLNSEMLFSGDNMDDIAITANSNISIKF